MHNPNVKIEGSGKLIVKRNGVVRAEKADDNMLLNGFYSKLMLQQPHLEMKAAIKVGMGYDASVPELTTLQTGLQPTSGLWPTAFLTPDGIAQVVEGKLVVNGFFNFTFEPGQIVGPLVEYGLDLGANTRPDLFEVDSRLVIMSGADLPLPMMITAQDQVLISYKITLTMDVVQPSKTVAVNYNGVDIPHQVQMNISKAGDIIEFLNLLGSKPSNDQVTVLVSPDKPIEPMVPYLPTTVVDVGDAVLHHAPEGIYVPITIGTGVEFAQGVSTVTFSDSWYQLVFTPPIVKTAQQIVKLTIGQGEYDAIDVPVVPVVPEKLNRKWLLPGSYLYFSLCDTLSHAATPCVDNGEMQLILTYSQGSRAPLGSELPLAETGFFTACDDVRTYIEDFKLGFAVASFTGKHVSFSAIADEYTLSSYIEYGGSKLELMYVWDQENEYPRPHLRNSDGSIGEPFGDAYEDYDREEVIRRDGWDRVYAGEAFSFSTSTRRATKLSTVLPLKDLPDFYGSNFPTTGYKALLGHGKWGVKLAHKTNPAMSISMDQDYWVSGNFFNKGVWDYNQSLDRFIVTKPFDSTNIDVAERDGLQLAIGIYWQSPTNRTPTKTIDTVADGRPTLAQLALVEGDDVYITYGVGAPSASIFTNYDIYIYIGAMGPNNTGMVLKCIPDVAGNLKWYPVFSSGEVSDEPATFDHVQLFPNRAGVCGFNISQWFVQNVGDFEDVPKVYGAKRILGEYDIRIFARPKNDALKPIVMARRLILKKSPWVYAPNGWVIGPNYGLFWFAIDAQIVVAANAIAQAGISVFGWTNYSSGLALVDYREVVPLVNGRFTVPGHKAVITVAADVFSKSAEMAWYMNDYYDVFLELTLSDGILRRAKYRSDNWQNHYFVPESTTTPGTFPDLGLVNHPAFYEHKYTAGHAEGGPVSLANQAVYAAVPNTGETLSHTRTQLDVAFLATGNLPISLDSEVMTLSVRMVRLDGSSPDLVSTAIIELTA